MAVENAEVLLVEDHELVRDSVSLALTLAGFRTAVATDLTLEAVVELARTERPDVVLLDYFLDDDADSRPMIEPLAGLGSQVLVLTGADDPEVWGSCLRAGAAGVFDKSRPLDELIDTVRAMQQGQPAMDPGERDRLLSLTGVQPPSDRHRHRHRVQPRERLERLTAGEADVLRRLIAGRAPEDIAREAQVSLTTVRNHVGAVLDKLGVSTTLAAVSLARDAGWG